MSRIAERLVSRTNATVLTETFSGPTSYTTGVGGYVFNSTILKKLERATLLQITGGYEGEVTTGSVSGNAFSVKIYTGTATGAVELPTGANLVSKALTVLLEGF